jgi:hypothetical protein
MPRIHDRASRDRSVRASDAERERVAEELRGHHLEGRLTADEFDERVGAAYASRTRGDLEALLIDLPASGGAPLAAPRTGPKPAWPVALAVGAGLLGIGVLGGVPWAVFLVVFALLVLAGVLVVAAAPALALIAVAVWTARRFLGRRPALAARPLPPRL